jgi:nitrate/nitrite transporter NarK
VAQILFGRRRPDKGENEKQYDTVICKMVFWTLSIVYSIKLRFGSWIFFHLQVK